MTVCRLPFADHVHAATTEATKEAATETPAAEADATAAAPAAEEAKKEAEPVEDGQLEHKGSNFPKYVPPPRSHAYSSSNMLLTMRQELHLHQEVLLVRLRGR